MIIVRLMGGMGNQMFQYAMAKSVSVKTQQTLKLDTTFFNNYKLHKYSLTPFSLNESIASYDELVMAKKIQESRFCRLRFAIERFLPVSKRYYFREKCNDFDSSVFLVGDNVYFDGYWQSEKYFSMIADCIRKQFKLKTNLDSSNKQIARLIQNSNSVSIHIRRANYITNKVTHSYHGVCKIGYYKKAVNFIKQRTNNPLFFVFSDDISWAKKHISTGKKTIYIEKNKVKKDYVDLFLMSNCKHNILANSTFSWWGAWLNNYDQKIVIAPQKWYVDPKNLSSDLLPHAWIKI